MFSLITLILNILTGWKVFTKYGEEGWKSLIPFYNYFVEAEYVWNTTDAIVFIILSVINSLLSNSSGLIASLIGLIVGIGVLILQYKFAKAKAAAFGGEMGLTLALFLVPFFGNLYIAFNDEVEYLGNMSE